MTMRNAFGDIATEQTVDEGLTLMRRMLALLKPLGVVTGGNSNRLSVEVNSGVLNTVTTVTTVNTLNNQSNMGGVPAFDLARAMSRTGYNTGVRANIT